MRKIVTLSMVAAAALAVSACEQTTPPAPTNDTNVSDTMPEPTNTVDECPRADGSPCL